MYVNSWYGRFHPSAEWWDPWELQCNFYGKVHLQLFQSSDDYPHLRNHPIRSRRVELVLSGNSSDFVVTWDHRIICKMLLLMQWSYSYCQDAISDFPLSVHCNAVAYVYQKYYREATGRAKAPFEVFQVGLHKCTYADIRVKWNELGSSCPTTVLQTKKEKNQETIISYVTPVFELVLTILFFVLLNEVKYRSHVKDNPDICKVATKVVVQ